MTYIHIRHGFVFLACVLDGFSRKIVGWAVSKRADAALVCEALDVALRERGDVTGLIHHSDQGSQDQCGAYLAKLDAAGIRKSMSRKGTPGDNAKMESCIRTVKVEEVYLNEYEDEHDARLHLGRFLEDVYNAKRLHSSLGYVPPDEFEYARRTPLLPAGLNPMVQLIHLLKQGREVLLRPSCSPPDSSRDASPG